MKVNNVPVVTFSEITKITPEKIKLEEKINSSDTNTLNLDNNINIKKGLNISSSSLSEYQLELQNVNIDSDFTKKFIGSNKEQRLKELEGLDPVEKTKLLESLREHFKGAGDKNSKENVNSAILDLSRFEISIMPPSCDDKIKSNAINVMKFINQHMTDSGSVDNPAKRDAAQFTGEEVLAEGNFNGCVEASKLFLTLVQGQDKNIDAKYVSSFSEVGAKKIMEELKKTDKKDEELIKNPPGHAVIQITDKLTGKSFIVDPSMSLSPELGNKVSEKDFRNGFAIKQFPPLKDALIEKKPEGIQLKLFNYGSLNNGEPQTKIFSNLDELNSYLNSEFGNKKVNLKEFEDTGIIKNEKDGGFMMQADQFTGKYIIFGKTDKSPFDSQFGPEGSSTKTFEAIKKYYEIK